ncbi:phosphatidylinositol 3-kinase [Polychaeton citri CBS 116435]|uniref:Phosphatidylinositol 3-kinase VPS34 n=1 Tax=Polychaeton citri CBS 116435 TaxID=1314669 RepID=A0A9P4UMW3_9PEZI|nr:phosphatidylinositol 3-kinase [Polychaeton citri CBS 116435]
MEPFTFASSSELRMPAAVKVNRLDGFEQPLPYSTLLSRPDLRHRGSNLSPNSELYVTVQPFADSKPLTVYTQTPYKHFKNGRVWNQWLTLPVEYSTLPVNTQLAITVWDLSPINPHDGDRGHHVPFGGTTIPLFDEDATLRMGRQKCKVWRHRAADGFSDTSTPWRERKRRRARRATGDDCEPIIVTEKQSQRAAELDRLVALMKKHEMGEIPTNQWLDQMVFRKIEKLERESVRDGIRSRKSRDKKQDEDGLLVNPGSKCAEGDADHVDGTFFLYIELPRFDHPIVFTDREYPPPPMSAIAVPSSIQATSGNINLKPPPDLALGPGIQSDTGGSDAADGGGRLISLYDPEIGHADNPAESKHRRLIRGQRTSLDRDLKPNPKMRDFLNRIMQYGPTVDLTDKEKDEVWRFRHHLTRDKRALTKLVKSVNWNESGESRQAIALLPKWVEIDVDDALELLGPGVENSAVRAYAVERLRKADDEELLMYLLQLVQALKFEPGQSKDESMTIDQDSSLASFLIARSAANLKLGNFLHWYLMVELDDTQPLAQGPGGNLAAVAAIREKHRKLFARVSYDFMKELDSTTEGQARRKVLLRQGELVTVLNKLCHNAQRSKGDRTKKIENLKKALADPKTEMLSFHPPIPLPLDPDVRVSGVVPEDCNIFKSSLLPLNIVFKTDTGTTYPLIFKTGDDLRQDQLVVQIIALMDRLLLKENLDLKLTPYRILATSMLAGAVQFVPSTPVSSILSNPKYSSSILGYLRFNNPCPPGTPSILGVRKETMDTYIKSLAGYCVITYLLGVGDRHLDNLLIAPDGHFFHIDFGYILGRDPKPMAPLMKLSREMVEGMGGSDTTLNSESQFETFRQYCFTAYTTLRRSSSLILNLFALMQDARIPGLDVWAPAGGANPGVGAANAAVKRVEERFKLDVSEEEALMFFGGLIESQMGSWGGAVIDRLHGFTQGWKT